MTSSDRIEQLKQQIRETSKRDQIQQRKQTLEDYAKKIQEEEKWVEEKMNQLILSITDQKELSEAQDREILKDNLESFVLKQQIMNSLLFVLIMNSQLIVLQNQIDTLDEILINSEKKGK